jgi:ATP-binding protein involved in chromosome partitioning
VSNKGSAPAPPELVERLGSVVDPLVFEPLGVIGTLRNVTYDTEGTLEVTIAVALEEYPVLDELAHAVEAVVGSDVRTEVLLEPMEDDERTALGEQLHALGGAGHGKNAITARAHKARVLAIASGKGGVGKSSVTVNLAVALARRGLRVGLLDADVYGFSVPRMLGIPYPPVILGTTIVPPVSYGVRVISMGFFANEDQAVAWRGPMLNQALEKFLGEVHWGELDYLLVDMPPGTGDVALSVAAQLPGAEMYVVTTPQPAAQRVAQRAGVLARRLRMPVRGVIENMAYFAAPDGVRYEIFGSGGGTVLADALEVPLLAQLPLVPEVREGADDGLPAVIVNPDSPVSQGFEALADRIVEMGPPRVYRSELTISS